MSKRLWKRFALLLSVVILLTSLVAPGARAASTMTAQMVSVTKWSFTLSLSWNAVAGASYYQIRYGTSPNTPNAYATTSATSTTRTMDSSLGYRYFKVYAYNGSGTLLASSNVVGIAKYPSGLVVRMKQDWALTNSYPAPSTVYGSPTYAKPTWFITVDPTVLASYVAPNFKMSEFIRQPGVTSALVDPKMVQHLQNARWRYGMMIVSSGYRTPWYNGSIGGSKFSRHLYGDGFDVHADSLAQYYAMDAAFAAEGPSYVESWAEAGQNHWHGDWRYETKGYTNY